jgi:hypothetical protein
VHDLNLVDAYIVAGNYAGILAGLNQGAVYNVEASGILEHNAINGYAVYFGGLLGRSVTEIENCGADIDIFIPAAQSAVYAGGLVGKVQGTVKNSGAQGRLEVCTENGNLYAGGLAGHAAGLTNCGAEADVLTLNKTYGGICYIYAGGLAGYISGGGTQRISTCYFTGKIEAVGIHESDGRFYVYSGGLIGYGKEAELSRCGANAAVLAKVAVAIGVAGAYAGGIVGAQESYPLSNCYTTGVIEARANDGFAVAGGIVGYQADNDFLIQRCYQSGGVIASGAAGVYAGGIAGYAAGSVYKCHWLYATSGEFPKAVGYSEYYGMPSDLGAVKYMSPQDMRGIAGDLGSAWVSKPNALPILRWQD